MKFSIRDLLWLMIVVAAAIIAWQNFVARGTLEFQNKALRSENANLWLERRKLGLYPGDSVSFPIFDSNDPTR
jgi:hypothetical protein